MLQIRLNSQNFEGITNHYVQRINLKRDKFGELGGKGLISPNAEPSVFSATPPQNFLDPSPINLRFCEGLWVVTAFPLFLTSICCMNIVIVIVITFYSPSCLGQETAK